MTSEQAHLNISADRLSFLRNAAVCLYSGNRRERAAGRGTLMPYQSRLCNSISGLCPTPFAIAAGLCKKTAESDSLGEESVRHRSSDRSNKLFCQQMSGQTRIPYQRPAARRSRRNAEISPPAGRKIFALQKGAKSRSFSSACLHNKREREHVSPAARERERSACRRLQTSNERPRFRV